MEIDDKYSNIDPKKNSLQNAVSKFMLKIPGFKSNKKFDLEKLDALEEKNDDELSSSKDSQMGMEIFEVLKMVECPSIDKFSNFFERFVRRNSSLRLTKPKKQSHTRFRRRIYNKDRQSQVSESKFMKRTQTKNSATDTHNQFGMIGSIYENSNNMTSSAVYPLQGLFMLRTQIFRVVLKIKIPESVEEEQKQKGLNSSTGSSATRRNSRIKTFRNVVGSVKAVNRLGIDISSSTMASYLSKKMISQEEEVTKKRSKYSYVLLDVNINFRNRAMKYATRCFCHIFNTSLQNIKFKRTPDFPLDVLTKDNIFSTQIIDYLMQYDTIPQNYIKKLQNMVSSNIVFEDLKLKIKSDFKSLKNNNKQVLAGFQVYDRKNELSMGENYSNSGKNDRRGKIKKTKFNPKKSWRFLNMARRMGKKKRKINSSKRNSKYFGTKKSNKKQFETKKQLKKLDNSKNAPTLKINLNKQNILYSSDIYANQNLNKSQFLHSNTNDKTQEEGGLTFKNKMNRSFFDPGSNPNRQNNTSINYLCKDIEMNKPPKSLADYRAKILTISYFGAGKKIPYLSNKQPSKECVWYWNSVLPYVNLGRGVSIRKFESIVGKLWIELITYK